jgi:transposase-like protein
MEKKTMNLIDLAQKFGTEDEAREFLEKKRWPEGPVCPHCGLIGEAYQLTPKPTSKSGVRKGVWKCKSCRKQFTVTVGTIFSDSHIPLHKWLMAIHLMCASKISFTDFLGSSIRARGSWRIGFDMQCNRTMR